MKAILFDEIYRERPNKGLLGEFNRVLSAVKTSIMNGITPKMSFSEIHKEVMRRYNNLPKEKKKVFDGKYSEKKYAPLIGDKLATIENFMNAVKLAKTR